MKRRILSLVLCFCMALSLLPMGALAATGDQYRIGFNKNCSFEPIGAQGGTLVFDENTITGVARWVKVGSLFGSGTLEENGSQMKSLPGLKTADDSAYFAYWSHFATGKDENGQLEKVTDNTSVPEPTENNTTLYAIWNYSITAADATITVPDEETPEKAQAGDAVVVTAPDGKYFENLSSTGIGVDKLTLTKLGDYTTGISFTMPASNVAFTYSLSDLPTYTVSFDLNAGSDTVKSSAGKALNTGIASRTAMAGQSYGESSSPKGNGLPEGLTREGYVFGGWATEQNGTVPVASSDQVLDNVTLYAIWTTDKYTISFDLNNNGDTVMNGKTNMTNRTIAPRIAEAGNTYAQAKTADGKYSGLPEGLTREGYTFGGWATEANGTTAVTPNEQVSTNVTLYAIWTSDEYTISFDLNNNGDTVMNGKTDMTNRTITPRIAKTGDTYNDATTGNPKYSGIPAAGSLTRDHYTFLGWSETGEEPVISENDLVTKTITLKAVWDPEELTVTFNADNGTDPIKQPVDYNATVAQPDDPTKEGYSFDNWYEVSTDEEGGETLSDAAFNFATQVIQDITLKAKWTPLALYVNFYDSEEATSPVKTQQITAGNTIPESIIPEVTTEGDNMILEGWYTDLQDETTKWTFGEEGNTVSKTIDLYPKWVQGYTITTAGEGVTFTINEEEVVADADPILAKEGDEITFSVAAADGYDLGDKVTESYKIGSTATSTDYGTEGSFTMPAADVTLTASATPTTYTVTLYHDGGVFNPEDANITTYTHGTSVALPTGDQITKNGYSFAGWYETKARDGEPVTEIPDTATGNLKYYAKWELETYTINYAGVEDAVNENPDSYTVKTNTFTLSEPTKENYVFTGWLETTKDGSPLPDATPQKEVTFEKGKVTGDRYYTANWEGQTFTVSLRVDGGTFTDETKNITSYTYGTAVPLPTAEDITRDGYVFAGWFPTKERVGDPVAEISDTDSGNLRFYAKWIKQYSVSVEIVNSNGDASQNATATISPEQDKFIPGDSVTVTVTPSEGYKVKSIVDKDSAATDFTADGNTCTFTVDKKDVVIQAEVVKDSFSIIVSEDIENGSVTTVPEGSAKYGAKVTVTADPANGYELDEFVITDAEGNPVDCTPINAEEGVEQAGNPQATFNMPASDVTVSATFTPIDYTIEYVLNGGKAKGENPTTYNVETAKIVFYAAEKAGFAFEGWFEKFEKDVFENQIFDLPTGSTGDRTLYAKFTPIAAQQPFASLNGPTEITYGDENGKLTANVRPDYNPEEYNVSYQWFEVVPNESGDGTTDKLVGETAADAEEISYSIPADALVGEHTYKFTVTVTRIDNEVSMSDSQEIKVMVIPAELTITAQKATKVYGEENDPVLSYTVDGLKNSDTVTGNLEREAGEDAGEYTINIGTLAVNPESHKDCYTVNFISNVLEITKVTPEVTAPEALDLTYNGLKQVLVTPGTTTGGTMKYSLDGKTWNKDYTKLKQTDADAYTMWWKVEGDKNYADVNGGTVDITIAQLPVEIKWIGTGENKDSFEYLFDGTEQGPTAEVANICANEEGTKDTCNVTLDGTPMSAVNNYVAEAVELSNDNYTLKGGQYLTQAYSIMNNPAEVVVLPNQINFGDPDATNLVYNGAEQELVVDQGEGYTIKYSLDNDSFKSAVPTGKDAGTYTVYYEVSPKNGYTIDDGARTGQVEVTIEKAPLTIKANPAEIAYGEEAPEPGVTYIKNGFVGNDDESVLNGTLTYTTKYKPGDPVSSDTVKYSITPAGLTSDNYEITFGGGRLTVVQKEVTIEWDEPFEFEYDMKPHQPEVKAVADVAEGVEPPVLDVTVEGNGVKLINGSAVRAGEYTATASLSANETNYVLAEGAATTQDFTITPKALEITWSNEGPFTYNGEAQAPEYEITGYVEKATQGDKYTIYDVEGKELPNGAIVAGTYTIAVETTNINHKLDAEKGTLEFTIEPAPVSIEWSDTSEFVYDGYSHKPTAKVVDSEGNPVGGLKAAVSVAGKDVELYNEKPVRAGNYTATATLPEGVTNYAIAEAATLDYEIQKKPLTIVWTNGTPYTYNGTAQAPTYEITGYLKNSTKTITETIVDENNTPVESAINAGAYTMTVTQNNPNFVLDETEATAEFVIEPAQLVITAGDLTATYGDPVPTYTATYDGFVNNETESVLTTPPTFACDYQKGSIAGEYAITPSGAVAANYDITYVPGKLTVGTKTADLSGEISKEDGNSENPSQSNENSSNVNSLVFTAATRAVRLLADGQESDTPEKSTLTVTIVDDLTYVYDGKAHTPKVEVKDGEDSLIQGKDFNVVYDKNVDAGTATVTVSWIDSGKYTEFDPVTKEFTITPKPITVTWTDVGPFTANGQPQSPKASIDAAELVVPEGSELKDPCTVNVTGAASAAGNYTATAVFSNPNYMAADGTGTQAFTINSAPSPSPGRTGGGGGGSSSYTVTVDKNTANGSVSADKTKASSGATVTVTASPAATYMVEGVTATYGTNNSKSVTVTAGSNGKYTFKMPSSNVTVSATFVKDPSADPNNDPSQGQDTIRNYSKDFEKCDDTHYENCPINQYPDASATAWYHDGVHFCIENGIMRGYDDGHFYPTKETTRAQLVQVLYNIAGQPNVTSDKSYSDVNAGDWFYKAVQWATKNDIVSGYNDGKFRPNDPITREQVARVLMGYAKFLGYDTSATSDLKGYSDTNTVSSWATEYVQWAVGAGVYCGPMGSQNLLAANGNTVRSELATMMMNFCTKLAK